jgi:hypothetical protein
MTQADAMVAYAARSRGLDISSREAEDPVAPTLVRRHGCPSSSSCSASYSVHQRTSCI